MAIKTNFKVNPETGKQDIKLGPKITTYDGHSAIALFDQLHNEGKLFNIQFYTQGNLVCSMHGKFKGSTADFALISSPHESCNQMYVTINNILTINQIHGEKEHYVINTSEGYFELNEI